MLTVMGARRLVRPRLVIATAHRKGGSGKTTLSTNLAAAAHLAGHRTVLVDMDAQGSAMEWSAARGEGSLLEGLAVCVGVTRDPDKRVAAARLLEMTDGYDVAILDCPARSAELTISAALFADVVVIPVTQGPLDVWSVPQTKESLDLADLGRGERGPVRRLWVLNNADPWVLASECETALREDPSAVYAGTVHHQAAFPRAIMRGESVLTSRAGSRARAEIQRLWRRVQKEGRSNEQQSSDEHHQHPAQGARRAGSRGARGRAALRG